VVLKKRNKMPYNVCWKEKGIEKCGKENTKKNALAFRKHLKQVFGRNKKVSITKLKK